MTGRRRIASRLDDLEDEADEREEWSDVEWWRAFITDENPRTGEPLSSERRAKVRRMWGEFAAAGTDPETDDAGDGRGPGPDSEINSRET